MVGKHVNKKNAGKPRVLAISALLHSLAAVTASFSAVAFYCYFYDAKPRSKWILREFDVSWIRPPAWKGHFTYHVPPPPPHPPQALKNCIQAAFQTLFLASPLFHLVQFAKCWQISFFGIKFQRSLSKFRKRNKNRCLTFRYSIEREIRTFHVVVVQRHGK